MPDATVSTGYDPEFLPETVPLPTAPGRDVVTLTYPRFSVTLDRDRKLAVVTGVNIDGSTLLDLPRVGDWNLDPRVPATDQAGPAVYANNDLDRGHLVRRRDPGWGDEASAAAATRATFFYPNAAPQAADFNQSKMLWLGLEDHVLAYAQAERVRISVFTAPVLADDDPPYRGIAIPRRFWKAIAWSTDDDGTHLAATGFVLDQSDLIDTAQGVVSVAPLGAFRTFQVPLAEIEQLAGVDLGPLVAADIVAVPAAGRTSWTVLDSVDDIRLA